MFLHETASYQRSNCDFIRVYLFFSASRDEWVCMTGPLMCRRWIQSPLISHGDKAIAAKKENPRYRWKTNTRPKMRTLNVVPKMDASSFVYALQIRRRVGAI